MAANTNTAALNAENARAPNTYENPNANPATSQGIAGSAMREHHRLGGDVTNPDAGYRGTTAPTGAQPEFSSTTGTGVGSSIGREANATGAAATHANTGHTGTVGGGDAPTTKGGGIGQQIKGAFAQTHGVGEVLRGKFNSAVDTMAGDTTGQAKDKVVTTGGEREYANKDFVKKGTTDKAL
ncbi:uncharacterized protein CTRU02_208302 [Colletotrichum truncatum]|uniref:Uncharacterized protein n=1 Tax=Colletotrichum truncatum TaxID=5467 RepID=A0ACC3YW30_COLTU|nr:uncharacterized protein CTRU02_07518 [Colletotrichum truncatum]KAF6791178.1 hypothetical protein CTRU02_07518 [Colletotrichum truncatum]